MCFSSSGSERPKCHTKKPPAEAVDAAAATATTPNAKPASAAQVRPIGRSRWFNAMRRGLYFFSVFSGGSGGAALTQISFDSVNFASKYIFFLKFADGGVIRSVTP